MTVVGAARQVQPAAVGRARVSSVTSLLSERGSALAILWIETVLGWLGVFYYLLAPDPPAPITRFGYFVLAPALTALLFAYRRGWEPARYLTMMVNTVVVGAVLPIPTEQFEYVPQGVMIPSAVAMILGGPGWVAGCAVGTLAIMVVRGGDPSGGIAILHVLTVAITTTCLVVSRLAIDAARKDAESRADRAEQARRHLEEQATQIRQQQARLHFHATLLDGVEQPVLATDPRGTVIYWNRGAERLFGWPADAILGRRFADLDGPPYDLPTDEAAWRDRAGEGPQTRDLDGRHRDGTPIPTSVSSWPFRDVDGTVLGRVAVITDLTERRAVERQRELFEQGQKLRALGQMAGGIAHDLNQVLAVVTGYVELALDDLNSQPAQAGGAETRAFLETAAQAAIQGSDSVKRLLTFARQQDHGPPEIVDVGQIIHDTVHFTAPQWRDRAQADGRPIQIELQVEPELCIHGWATALREALMNLVLNAVDALPEGGAIQLRARRQDSTVVIEVADTGVGMPPSVRERIFEPFYTTKGDRGTGLGLAMVFGIVEHHGGTVTVTSAEGAGTTFRLALPEATATRLDPVAEVPSVAALPVRILVVDDEPRLVRMLTALLGRDRHDVESVVSGEAAIARLEAGGYDLVISDLSMGPGMNGWDLAREVRERWPDTRFVLASGWGAGISEREAQSQMVDAVLAKPYRADELRRVVSRLTT